MRFVRNHCVYPSRKSAVKTFATINKDQCDADGVMVKVSRQALDRNTAAIDRLIKAGNLSSSLPSAPGAGARYGCVRHARLCGRLGTGRKCTGASSPSVSTCRCRMLNRTIDSPPIFPSAPVAVRLATARQKND